MPLNWDEWKAVIWISLPVIFIDEVLKFLTRTVIEPPRLVSAQSSSRLHAAVRCEHHYMHLAGNYSSQQLLNSESDSMTHCVLCADCPDCQLLANIDLQYQSWSPVPSRLLSQSLPGSATKKSDDFDSHQLYNGNNNGNGNSNQYQTQSLPLPYSEPIVLERKSSWFGLGSRPRKASDAYELA
ncbi:hypothetical protein GQ42DRAFT_165647 [Ramicandelaber brevisporus]|nr:hypothetical protein GQ42DRAFT_165647 [Ramicandelaber brevisporus]